LLRFNHSKFYVLFHFKLHSSQFQVFTTSILFFTLSQSLRPLTVLLISKMLVVILLLTLFKITPAFQQSVAHLQHPHPHPQCQLHTSNLFSSSSPTEKLYASAAKPNRSLLKTVYRFSRPHTLIGTALSIPALHALAAPNLPSFFTLTTFNSVVFALIPSLLINVFITGLNQMSDVEIDKINKPYLHMAAGYLSMRKATLIILACLTGGLSFAASSSPLSTPGLKMTLLASTFLGAAYSLPPLRLKRFPLFAAFCIVAVRGAILNVGFYSHALVAAFGGSTTNFLTTLKTDKKCQLVSLFFGTFGVVIALMKDVPDTEGDKKEKIRTLSVRIGRAKMFLIAR